MTSSSSPQTVAARAVVRVVRGRPTSDGAGVRLLRSIGGPELPDLDPFLLLDEFGSDTPADYVAGFPSHPHRGFETVTYMLEGRVRHRDDHGHEGVVGPGGVQWMTAGRGIVHSEMPEQDRGRLRGFQLWVNLPAREKMTAPRYQEIDAAEIPEAAPGPGVRVRVVAGRFAGVEGPVRAAATDPLYLDVALEAGARVSIPVPQGHRAVLRAYEGAPAVAGTEGEQPLAAGDLAVLGEGDRVDLAAGAAAARLLVVAGRPLGEPVARLGPFVMTTRAELRQAIEDFNAGRF